jgi:hypothetical protein
VNGTATAAVLVCTATERDVGELQILRADLDREIDDLLDAADTYRSGVTEAATAFTGAAPHAAG